MLTVWCCMWSNRLSQSTATVQAAPTGSGAVTVCTMAPLPSRCTSVTSALVPSSMVTVPQSAGCPPPVMRIINLVMKQQERDPEAA